MNEYQSQDIPSSDSYKSIKITMYFLIGIMLIIIIMSLHQVWKLFRALKFSELKMLQTIILTFICSLFKEIYMVIYISILPEIHNQKQYNYPYIFLVISNMSFIMAFTFTFSKW